ncbi:hypothetical protein [Methylocystis rosea]|uniref:Uncharacterized protein n=1 Tax=Methylocystis rosea TaxID=173366 RepID=A0A3G8M5F5_9HYPH|nr:hypothetical protein [Methylocystis rosea]AZG76310.1 hypothetical protein EHO51_05970 [Methylocystis rosea]
MALKPNNSHNISEADANVIRMTERLRMQEVLQHPASAGRLELATRLLVETSLSGAEIASMLESAPKPAAASASAFFAAMNTEGGVDVNAPLSEGGAIDPKKARLAELEAATHAHNTLNGYVSREKARGVDVKAR